MSSLLDRNALEIAYMNITSSKCNLIMKGIEHLERIINYQTKLQSNSTLVDEKQIYKLLLVGYHRLGMTRKFNALKNRYSHTKTNRIPDKVDISTSSSFKAMVDVTQGADLIVDLDKLEDLSINTALWSFIFLSSAFST